MTESTEIITHNRYYIKRENDGDFVDIERLYPGLSVLSFGGLIGRGAAKNIYIQKWVNSQKVDLFIPKVVCFEKLEVAFSFIITNSNYLNGYIVDSDGKSISIKDIHNSMIDDLIGKKIQIKSKYVNETVTLISISKYEPSEIILSENGQGSDFISGIITFVKL